VCSPARTSMPSTQPKPSQSRGIRAVKGGADGVGCTLFGISTQTSAQCCTLLRRIICVWRDH
jgi:hypothetical protein